VASSGLGVAHRRQVWASGGTSVPLAARRRPASAAASVAAPSLVGGAKAVGAVAPRAAGGTMSGSKFQIRALCGAQGEREGEIKLPIQFFYFIGYLDISTS
jgi:hypothetical protein